MMKEMVIDQRFLNDLYLFYRLFIVNKFGRKGVRAEHIKELSRHLMALSLGVLLKHLAVSMPPRNSKSSMITLAFPLWLIFQDPNLNILIINNTITLSEKFGIALRDAVREYGYLFNVYLSDVKHSSTHLMFCDKDGNLYNGSIRLTGAGGSITGQDADYIIIDDPYKGEEEEFTPTALQKKIDWFNRVVEQRVEPHTKLLILHTRWHSNDLIGYLQREQATDYKFITFPAIKQDNTPLWPEKYTLEELEKKKGKVGERLFSSIWQQKPLDDTSDFFDIDNIKYKPLPQNPIHTVRSWDISKGDTLKSDYTAGTLLSSNKQNQVATTDLVYGQFGNKTKDIIFETAERDGKDVIILIETGVAAAGDLLFQEWKRQLKGYRVKRAKTINSKVDRATPLKNSINDGNFFVDIEDDGLVEIINTELRGFPDGVHDDITDALSHGFNYLSRKGRRRVYI